MKFSFRSPAIDSVKGLKLISLSDRILSLKTLLKIEPEDLNFSPQKMTGMFQGDSSKN